jgi:hypothetical protein
MPLRDHFHPPLRDSHHWEGFHSAWVNTLVRHLNLRQLPARYRAEPQVHLGTQVEVDVATFEVRVYDEQRGSHLVAAVELVSPSNKDRAAHRRAFAVKCAAYLQQGVALVVVDIVTDRHENLHAELMGLLQLAGSTPWPEATHLYAVAYRTTKEDDGWRMDTWPEALAPGAALPTLPLWLASDLAVPLELEAAYEETRQVLRVP